MNVAPRPTASMSMGNSVRELNPPGEVTVDPYASLERMFDQSEEVADGQVSD